MAWVFKAPGPTHQASDELLFIKNSKSPLHKLLVFGSPEIPNFFSIFFRCYGLFATTVEQPGQACLHDKVGFTKIAGILQHLSIKPSNLP